MTAISVGAKTYSDVPELVVDHPELLVHQERLAEVIASKEPARWCGTGEPAITLSPPGTGIRVSQS